MSMYDIQLFDETLDSNQTSAYHISLEISSSKLSYCILDTVRLKYIALTRYSIDPTLSHDIYCEKVEEIFKEDQFLKQKYKSAQFLNKSSRYTLVPEEYFSENQVRNYFEFTNKLYDLDELHYNYIPQFKVYSIYALSNRIANEIKNNIPNTHFYHQSIPYLSSTIKKDSHKPKTRTYLHLSNGLLEIAIIENESLKFYNIFSYENENDVIYFVVNVYKTLGISREEIPLYCSGEIDRKSKHVKLLSQYIANISFIHLSKKFTYSYKFRKTNTLAFINLLNLYNCG